MSHLVKVDLMLNRLWRASIESFSFFIPQNANKQVGGWVISPILQMKKLKVNVVVNGPECHSSEVSKPVLQFQIGRQINPIRTSSPHPLPSVIKKNKGQRAREIWGECCTETITSVSSLMC